MLIYPNEGELASWNGMSFSLSCVFVGAAGLAMAAQGLFPGSASVCGLVCLSRLGRWGCGVRISGQGPDQTIQESEIYKK